MIETHICPFCGNEFKCGWDPETTIMYDICHIRISKMTDESFDNKESFICLPCYDKMIGDINTLERRIKNEQPEIP